MKHRYSFIAGIVLILATLGVSEINERPSDPCCSFPCQQMGICMSSDVDEYECDCTGTGYYGTHCEILRLGLLDDPHMYSGFDEYVNWDAHANTSVYARSLPAVPLNCPTPMGVKGKKTLPDVELLEKFLLRDSFKPCPRRTSVVFPLFAQHFSHQFFKTDVKKGLPYQWGNHEMDLSHVYGNNYERQHALRLHLDGKLKYSIKNGEVFPPTVDDANVKMDGIDKIEKQYQFAVGHPGFTLQPTLLFFATLWLREHNRVCDILKQEHPSWEDERLFQTARLILTGETMKIVVEDYVQHLSGYNYKLFYDPELLHDSEFSYNNRIFVEFQLLYRWHALVPDELDVGNRSYGIRNLIFNPKPFINAGMSNWVDMATRQFAGKVAGGKSQGHATLNVAREAIREGRKLRLQSFNRYRQRFGMRPYKSFHEFIEDPEMAKELEEIYGDVDAMEFFLGVMLEKRRTPLMFGQTLTEVGSPFSFKGIYSNPIGSPEWWKPSTFGGKKGFDIVKSANLQELVCRNVEGCPTISFEVPYGVKYIPKAAKTFESDNSSRIIMKMTRGYHVPDQAMDIYDITKSEDVGISSQNENVKSEL